MTFREQLRQAAQNAQPCDGHGREPPSATDDPAGWAAYWVRNCDDCANLLVAAVLDEFMRAMNAYFLCSSEVRTQKK